MRASRLSTLPAIAAPARNDFVLRCQAWLRRWQVGLYSLLFTLAIVLRLIFIFNPGFEADISFWKSWGLATYDKGIVEGMKVTNNNYPTPFAYVLGSMVWVYSRFADPHNFNEFWSNTNLLFLAISKLYPILADFGIAAVILYIGRNTKRLGFPDIQYSVFKILALVYLLSPLSLIDGAWWGQVDSLGIFVFLSALLSALKRRSFLAGLLFMLAMMTKLQNMIYGPIFFLFIWQTAGFDGLIRSLLGAAVGFFGLNIEFFLTKNMDRVLASLTENFDYFPWMSLNAFNLWWVASGAHGMQVSDKLSVLGILNAKTVGLLLFSSFYLFAVLRQVFESLREARFAEATARRAGPIIQLFLESLILVNAAFFLFQTQSHDRYAFPLSVFLLLWAPFLIVRVTKINKRHAMIFAICYVLFTLVYFYNLHTALVFNYPDNGLPWLSLLIQPIFTIGASLTFLTLFGILLITILRTTRAARASFGVVVLVFVSGLILLNKPLITKQPVSLTKFTPYISQQGYGTRQTNRSVQSSFGGPNGWTRLSVQYAFYKEGIGTHANSKQVFDINRKFKTFTTDFGIDTEAGASASAVFEIYGDTTLLFRSDKMGRFDAPKHTSVNVKGVKFLTVITTDADDGNFDDHTDWLNPQLWP